MTFIIFWYRITFTLKREVLQQFPDDVLEEANAFYMTSTPENKYDLGLQKQIVSACYHCSVVKALVLKK